MSGFHYLALMTFLNPLVLFGLAAAAIPIIIHLLNLRKLKNIEFSSLRFLKEMQKTRMRRVRIRQWILLLLRTLLIVALVLAFARPALRGGLAGVVGTHARTTGVALLDDSPSMGVRTDRGIMFTRGREVALRAAGLLKEGDELFIIRLSDVGHVENPAPARTPEEAARLVGPATVSSVTVPYREAVGLAARLLNESHNFNREMYILSDLQKSQFAAAAPLDTADLFDDGVRVFLSAPALPRQDNAGIADVSVISRILVPGRPVQLRALIRNFGTSPVQNGLVSVYLDGTRVLQRSVDIPPGGSLSPALTVIPKRSGFIHGYVQLEDDALEADNRRSFVLDVPGSVRLLVVGPTEAETRLAVLALTLGGDSSAATLNVRTITEAQFSSVDVTRFDVVVTCGLRGFSPSDATRLAQFVRAGGGMLMFPGEATEITEYNAGIFAALDIPAARPVVQHGSPGGGQTPGGFLSFGTVDFSHPLFAGLFDEGLQQRSGKHPVESPQVHRSIVLQPGTRGQAIITLSDGTPFIAEYLAGNGRVLVVAVETGMGWSDFPMRGLFVPFLHRSATYLAARSGLSVSVLAGQQPRWDLRVPDRTDRDVFVIHAPDNTEEKVVPRFNPVSGLAAITSAPAMIPGVYDLQRATAAGEPMRTLAAVAVNTDPAESDLAQADESTLEGFWARVGVQPAQVVSLRGDEELERTVYEARFGVELWKYLAGLAVLLAMLEMVIGREGKKSVTGGQE
jgi:hypothetical protein